MPTSRLPLDIKNFLIESIDSVAHLEVLLLLYQNFEKQWDAHEVSRELRSNFAAATIQLENLARNNLIFSHDSKPYKYDASDETLNGRVQQLLDLYHDKPVAIISCIYERPTDKLKGFADAFKLRKD